MLYAVFVIGWQEVTKESHFFESKRGSSIAYNTLSPSIEILTLDEIPSKYWISNLLSDE